ncbi:hypothetical protein JXO52_10875 [bacterium]|nr:hypothetical protein [bacterium]
MNVTVIGAGGGVGRVITQLIIAERLLDRNQHLELIGNPEGSSKQSLHGFAADLMDAYAGTCPRLTVLDDPAHIKGDLIIMAAGKTIPLSLDEGGGGRAALADENIPVFEYYASALAKYGHGNEIVICISNPNELATAVFAKHLDNARVIGMGSFLDSLRFRKEIALDLGIRRQRIHAFMIGEHGADMIPVWSGVHIYGFQGDLLENALFKIRRGYDLDRFPDEVAAIRKEVIRMIGRGDIKKCYQTIERYPPDIRTVVRPFITHYSGAKTVVGTANATLEFIHALTTGHDAFISGQLTTKGAFHGIDSTIGVPFILSNQGVEKIVEIGLSDPEKQLLCRCAENVNKKLAPYL